MLYTQWMSESMLITSGKLTLDLSGENASIVKRSIYSNRMASNSNKATRVKFIIIT